MRRNEDSPNHFQVIIEKPFDGVALAKAVGVASTTNPSLIEMAEPLGKLTRSDMPRTVGGWLSETAVVGMKETIANPDASENDREWAGIYLADLNILKKAEISSKQ